MRGRVGMLLVAAAIVFVAVGQVQRSNPTGGGSDHESASGALPRQAIETIRLIDSGGPFPYARDGIVFMNRERLLPQHSSGYWHEYTVPTPGESDRGARRIIHGAGGEFFYTGDHYASFTRVTTRARGSG